MKQNNLVFDYYGSEGKEVIHSSWRNSWQPHESGGFEWGFEG